MDFDEIMKTLARLPKDDAHRELYEYVLGKKLDLENPCDLNEKLQWLMVYRYDENVSAFADKLAVRDYVRSCGYENILTKLYGIYESEAEAKKGLQHLDEKKFILKCNHGSGPQYYSICRDKDSFDSEKELGKLAVALRSDYSLVALEYFYHFIKPYIFAEELIGENCTDYKFFCFGGVPKYVKVIAERGDRDENGKQIKHQDYYDMDWNFCPLVKDEISMGGGLERPAGFEYMKEIAAKLSEPFSVARIDLYYENGKVYFGEVTLTPAFGMNKTDKPETLEMLGKLTDLTYWKPEKLVFGRTDEITQLLQKNKFVESIEETDRKMKALGLRLLKASNLLFEFEKEKINGICADCCQILGGDKDDVIKSIYMTILYNIAFRDDMSLEECWQIFWNLTRVTFVNSRLRFISCDDSEGDDVKGPFEAGVKEAFGAEQRGCLTLEQKGLLDAEQKGILDGTEVLRKLPCSDNYLKLSALYKRIYDFVESNICYDGMCYRENDERNKDLILLVTSQFLNIGHAPTQRVLDYAYEFQHNLGKKVIIINDGGMHFYRNKHLGGVAAFNFIENYNEISSLEHKGEVIEFFQIPSLMPDLGVLQELVRMIYDLNPLLVFNVGGSSLLTDLCTGFVTTASMPCRVEYPVCCSKCLLVAKTVSESDPEYPAPVFGQRVIETNFNYVYRPSDKMYARAEFGIPEDAFLMTAVGYRIGEEIDEGFLEMISSCYKDFGDKHNIYTAIVGVVDEIRKEEILCRMPSEAGSKIIFAGQLADASEFIRLANLNLNPDRNGGGRSAFESLYFGIPVVTLRNGDVYYVAGDEFGVENYEAYADAIRRYCSDNSFYKEKCEKALARAEVLGDMTGTLKKALDDIIKEV